MKAVMSLVLLILLATFVRAETVDWVLGKPIDCPVAVSLPTKPVPRTVILPGGNVTEILQSWFEDQVEVRYVRNTVSIKLKDPVFSGTIQIYDDKGNLYLLNVRAPRPDESVAESLTLRPGSDGSSIGEDGLPKSSPIDSDGAITEMMVTMFNGVASGTIASSIQYRMSTDQKSFVVGERIMEDDSISWYLLRVWQGPRLRGFETVLTYKGKGSFRVPYQRWWFPGALAIMAADQIILDPSSPQVSAAQGQPIRLFFVVE